MLLQGVLAAFVWSLPGSVALILHVAPAGRPELKEPLADVYGLDAHGRPADEQTVEMLRFVTAYGTGIEALVDVTPYSPLLSAGSGSDGLTFYAFIDTWVNNETGMDALYMNNLTQQCTPIVRSYGNGWNLSAELLFWSKPEAHPVRRAKPYHMVTLASGFYGANYALGRISIRTGRLAPKATALVLDEAAELDRASSARVYGCDGGPPELQYAAQLGFFSQQVEEMVRKNKSTKVSKVDLLINTTFKEFALSDLVKLADAVPIEDGREAHLDNRTQSGGHHLLRAKFNAKTSAPEKGMPIFLAPGDVFTDQEISPGVWWNLSYPLDPVGRIVSVGNGTLDLLLSIACMPTNHTVLGSVVPRLLMAKDSKVLPILHARLTEAARMGIAAANSSRKSNESTAELRFLRPETLLLPAGNISIEKHAALREPHLLGRIVTTGPNATGPSSSKQLLQQPNTTNMAGEKKICVVEQEQQGTLFERSFKLPEVARSDRIVLQLTVTGHGWAATTEQCGEYCHAVYLLRLNGQLARNVSQFRNDCKDNPIGVDGTQHGTWWESRNGWCPGTVEPGTFMDVTKWLHPGDNRLEMEVLVWNEMHSRYESYTDYSGFAFDDAANLVVGLNLFVYNSDAVAMARAMAIPSSAAEEALKTGTGGTGFVDMDFQTVTAEAPVQLLQLRRGLVQPHSHVGSDLSEEGGMEQNRTQSRAELIRSRMIALALKRSASQSFTPSMRLRGRSGETTGSWRAAEVHDDAGRRIGGSSGPNFESSTPWYLYNSSNVTSEQLASQAEALRVPVITTALMQGARRNVAFHVEASALPKQWSQVALHFRLAKPGGALQYDRWDRLGSFGLRLDQAAQRVAQFAERPPAPKTLWAMEA